MANLTPPSANIAQYVGSAPSLPTLTKLAYDASGNVEYVGEASPGSATSSAVWRVQKLTYDGSGNLTTVATANGGAFDQIWDNRASLTYA